MAVRLEAFFSNIRNGAINGIGDAAAMPWVDAAFEIAARAVRWNEPRDPERI